MSEIIPINGDGTSDNNDIFLITENILLDVWSEAIPKDKAISVPITELSVLGAGVSSLIPALNTVTQTNMMDVQGMYKLANASAGDVLKVAKNGNF